MEFFIQDIRSLLVNPDEQNNQFQEDNGYELPTLSEIEATVLRAQGDAETDLNELGKIFVNV